MSSYKTIPDTEGSTLLLHAENGAEGLAFNEESASMSSSPKSWMSKMKSSSGLMAFLGAFSAIVVIAGVAPQGFNLLGIRRMAKSSVIQVCVEEHDVTTLKPSVGATVTCDDIDSWTTKDHIGSATTGSDGCASIYYDGRAWWDYYPGYNAWKPDVLCSATKPGFVINTPYSKTNVDTSKTAKFTATLFRDRMTAHNGVKDYGHPNGCGPDWLEKYGVNAAASYILGFKDQCNNHDRCYFDCHILNAFGMDDAGAMKAMKFCDDEMLEGMNSLCHRNHGSMFGVTDDACRGVAYTVYSGIQKFAQDHYAVAILGKGDDKKDSCVDDSPPSENKSWYNVY